MAALEKWSGKIKMKKAQNLELLANCYIRVPKGFTVPASHFQAAISPVVDQIQRELASGHSIGHIFDDIQFSGELEEAISQGLNEIQDTQSFAVRSSGVVWSNGIMVGEDSDTVSLAGQFESYLNVPRLMVPAAIKQCWASMFSSRCISRFSPTEQFVEKSMMTVLVQEMIIAEASAVMMTMDPQGDGRTGALECAWGACAGIVGGKVSPDEIIFSRADGHVLSKAIGSKETVVTHAPFAKHNDNVISTPASEHQRNSYALSDSNITQLIMTGKEIERIFGKPQDIEAVLSQTGQIIITQARTITTLPRN